MAREAASLFVFARPHRLFFGAGFFALIVSSALGLCFPFFAGGMIDAAVRPVDRAPGWIGARSLGELLGLVLAAAVLQGVSAAAAVRCFSAGGLRTVFSLRCALFARLVELPMEFFAGRRVGELASRLAADVVQIETVLTSVAPLAGRRAITLVGGIALILATSPRLAMVALGVVPLLAALASVLGRRMRRLSRDAQDRLSEAGANVVETLHGVATVKAFANEAHEVSRYRESLQRLLTAATRSARAQALFNGIMPIAVFGSIAVVIWCGAQLLQDGEISAGEFTRFILYATFAAAAMGQATDLFTRFQHAMGATARLRELLRETPEVSPAGRCTGADAPSRAIGHVRFEHVSFRYPTRRETLVLDDVVLAARPGERVALVGPSGAGKSTLTALLLRLYEPASGRILIDGRDVRECALTWLRRQIAIVPQDVLLFGGSIEDNIGYGRPGATSGEIRAAARIACADEFISGFPDGYATIVGERGVKLSGGQRQRIAIARAILKDPPILVLDEATSSLDSESERLVQQALEALMRGRTTFIIAHRLATVRSADRIVVLDAGRIVEQGAHAELLARDGGLYRKLSALQIADVHTETCASLAADPALATARAANLVR